MILRFKTNADFLAINTDLAIYVTNPEIVREYPPIEIQKTDYLRIMRELDFNDYSYSESLFEDVETEDIPF